MSFCLALSFSNTLKLDNIDKPLDYLIDFLWLSSRQQIFFIDCRNFCHVVLQVLCRYDIDIIRK